MWLIFKKLTIYTPLLKRRLYYSNQMQKGEQKSKNWCDSANSKPESYEEVGEKSFLSEEIEYEMKLLNGMGKNKSLLTRKSFKGY